MEKKTSKRFLNMNAIKFKLQKLHSKNIRYEVIYKNLVRDIRKFISKEFNSSTDYMRKKRKSSPQFYLDCLIQYVKDVIGIQIINCLDISVDDCVFICGSLIYPKEMLKLYTKTSEKRAQVIKIYHYLYKFSLERLQKMINNPCIMIILSRYLKANGASRITGSANMAKQKEAYFEAIHKMLSESNIAGKIMSLMEVDVSQFMPAASNTNGSPD